MTAAAQANPFLEFIDRYQFAPVLFVREVFGAEPDAWQCELLEAVARGERRISVRSGHGVGKSTALAWLICWYICTRYPQKTVATAPTTAQLFDALAAETFAWMRKLPPQLGALFNMTTERIELVAAPEESFVSFRTSRPETPEALAGVHSANVLLLGDEASGIPEKVYEAAAGSMSGHNATTVLAGNPVRTSGLFFDTHHKLKGMWHTIHVSCLTCSRVSTDFVEDMKRRYGELSNAFRVRVLGEFPKSDDDTVISYELVQRALVRDVEPIESQRPIWGLDVARFGDDTSALAKRRGNVLLEPVKEWKDKLDTMQLAGAVKAIYDATLEPDRPCEINIDAIGVGAGVADRLRELGLPARAINVSESPALGEKFINLRAELWWKAREWFEKLDCKLADEPNLGTDEKSLADELVGPKYVFTSSGKVQVESKKDMKKRGLRSPNKADAFNLTFATDATIASGAASGAGWGKALKRVIAGMI